MNFSKIIIFFFFIRFSFLNAQEIVWFDVNGKETSKENAQFYRPKPAEIKKGLWIVDYYKNGVVKKEGLGTNSKLHKEQYNGLVVEYFKNGKPSKKQSYRKGVLQGVSKEYFKTGELKTLCRYRDNKRDGVWKEFYKTGKIKTKGRYRDNEKVGVWKTFYKNVSTNILDY